jgi:hypothetical protein
MYIFELIAKIIKNKPEKKIATMPEENDYSDVCAQAFFPVDSTNETFACSKCGLVVKKDALKIMPKNPFIK